MSLRQILNTATIRQSTITTLTTVVNGLLGLAFFLLLARLLGPTQYGLFIIAATFIPMLSDMADLGANQSLVKFLSRHRNSPVDFNRVAKLNLKVKFFSGLALFVLLALFSSPIANFILHQSSSAILVPLIGAGVLTQLLFSFATSYFQAIENFLAWASLLIGANFFRLVLLLVVFMFGLSSGYSATLIYILLPLFCFLVFFSRRHDFLSVKNENSKWAEIFSFNAWVTAFTLVAAVGARLDIFFTARLLSLEALASYGLATQAVAILPQLTGSIGAVTSPKFSSFTTYGQNKTYVFKALGLTTAIALISSFLLVPVTILILKFTGHEFASAISAFWPLLAAMFIFLATAPIRDSIFYYFAKPQFFFWIGICHMALISITSLFLIPKLGIFGAGAASLIGQIFIALTSSVYFLTHAHHES